MEREDEAGGRRPDNVRMPAGPSAARSNVQHGSVVDVQGAEFSWPGRRSFSLTIDAFRVARGERLLLLGPSGGGKSTLLALLAGIVAPQRGRIEILGTDIAGLSGAARDSFRSEHFGIIFQMFNLLPYGTVLDNVLLPLSFSQSRRDRASAAGTPADEARRLMRQLGLEPAEISSLDASSLSVGQQQRVAAARALIGRPELIVADEPTSALDRASQDSFLKLLFDDAAASDATVLMVSHDETLAPLFSRVVRLQDIAKAERAGS